MSVRAAGVVCMMVLVGCGEPATVPTEVSDSVPESTTSTVTTAVPFATSPTSTGTTATSIGSETTPVPSVQDRSDPGLEGAPEWFDLEQVITILEDSGEAFEVIDVSTYRFRSTLTVVVEGEELLGEEGATAELIGEVTKEPPAVHWVVTGPPLEDGNPAYREELIMIDGQAWMTEGYGIWEELSSPPSQPPFYPVLSYDVAAAGAAHALKRADALRDGTISVVSEEEIIGLDVLYLHAFFVDSTTDDQADIWITPTGLLVSFRYRAEHHDSADSEEFTWDIYDLDADIEIQPPVP